MISINKVSNYVGNGHEHFLFRPSMSRIQWSNTYNLNTSTNEHKGLHTSQKFNNQSHIT